MPKQIRLQNAVAGASGTVTHLMQGDSDFSIRYATAPGSSTFNYTVKATLTENESLANGHTIASGSGATGSVLVEGVDKQYYAIAIGYDTLSAGTMSIFLNAGGGSE